MFTKYQVLTLCIVIYYNDHSLSGVWDASVLQDQINPISCILNFIDTHVTAWQWLDVGSWFNVKLASC